MNCDQRRDLMPLLLPAAPEPADAGALRAHLATGCTRCAAHLAEADATLGYLPYALDAAQPAPAAKQRLMARLGEHAAVAERPAGARPGRTWTSTWVRRLAPPAVAACLTFV